MRYTRVLRDYLYQRLTDTDISSGEYLKINYKKRPSNEVLFSLKEDIKQLKTFEPSIRVQIAGVRLSLKTKKYKPRCVKYVKFTKEQKEYLRRIFKKTPYVKDYSEILERLTEMSYSGQELSIQKVYTFFKNERHRLKYETENKHK